MQTGAANHQPAPRDIGPAAREHGSELRLEADAPCYVPLALTVRRGPAPLVCLCSLAAALATGCGGGERQDANEREASYEVSIVGASFPERQRLAQTSELEITVRNEDSETIPDLAVTVDGLQRRLDDRDLSDPNRPVFVVNGVPVEIGGHPDAKLAAPEGGQTALVNTWALGELEPGAERTFAWTVTAVEPGPFEVSYVVNAGLHGKARAVEAVTGDLPHGSFQGTVTSRPPASRIAADGVTVINPKP